MHNKRKIALTVAASAAAMALSSPALAAIHTYDMTNGDVLKIDTTTKSATLKGKTINAAMKSDDFAKFQGGKSPTGFVATLSDLTGQRLIRGKWVNDNPYKSDTTHPQMLKFISRNRVNLWAWWGNPINGGDYVPTIAKYTPPTAVPAPGMLGIFGLALIGLWGAARMRKSKTKVSYTGMTPAAA